MVTASRWRLLSSIQREASTVGWRRRIEWEENRRNRGEGIQNRQQAGVHAFPRFSLSLSFCPPSSYFVSLSNSLLLYREVSQCISWHLLPYFPPAWILHFSLLLWYVCLFASPSFLPFFLSFTPASSSSHHGEQITARPSWDHGCLPLQRSQRSVSPVCVSVWWLDQPARRTWQQLKKKMSRSRAVSESFITPQGVAAFEVTNMEGKSHLNPIFSLTMCDVNTWIIWWNLANSAMKAFVWKLIFICSFTAILALRLHWKHDLGAGGWWEGLWGSAEVSSGFSLWQLHRKLISSLLWPEVLGCNFLSQILFSVTASGKAVCMMPQLAVASRLGIT